MKQSLRRLATAAALAFATAAIAPAIAQETQAPQAGETTYKAAGEPRVLLSCTKDGHSFRILSVPGAPASVVDTAPDSVPAKDFLDGMESAINAVVGKYNFDELRATEAPLTEVNKAINDYLAAFNAKSTVKMGWAILDFGLSADKDPACGPKAPAP